MEITAAAHEQMIPFSESEKSLLVADKMIRRVNFNAIKAHSFKVKKDPAPVAVRSQPDSFTETPAQRMRKESETSRFMNNINPLFNGNVLFFDKSRFAGNNIGLNE